MIEIFFDALWNESRKRLMKFRFYYCQLKIPEDVYELLSYRVLSYRSTSLKWLLPKNICDQLKVKFETMKRVWQPLSAFSDWPIDCLL